MRHTETTTCSPTASGTFSSSGTLSQPGLNSSAAVSASPSSTGSSTPSDLYASVPHSLTATMTASSSATLSVRVDSFPLYVYVVIVVDPPVPAELLLTPDVATSLRLAIDCVVNATTGLGWLISLPNVELLAIANDMTGVTLWANASANGKLPLSAPPFLSSCAALSNWGVGVSSPTATLSPAVVRLQLRRALQADSATQTPAPSGTQSPSPSVLWGLPLLLGTGSDAIAPGVGAQAGSTLAFVRVAVPLRSAAFVSADMNATWAQNLDAIAVASALANMTAIRHAVSTSNGTVSSLNPFLITAPPLLGFAAVAGAAVGVSAPHLFLGRPPTVGWVGPTPAAVATPPTTAVALAAGAIAAIVCVCSCLVCCCLVLLIVFMRRRERRNALFKPGAAALSPFRRHLSVGLRRGTSRNDLWLRPGLTSDDGSTTSRDFQFSASDARRAAVEKHAWHPTAAAAAAARVGGIGSGNRIGVARPAHSRVASTLAHNGTTASRVVPVDFYASIHHPEGLAVRGNTAAHGSRVLASGGGKGMDSFGGATIMASNPLRDGSTTGASPPAPKPHRGTMLGMGVDRMPHATMRGLPIGLSQHQSSPPRATALSSAYYQYVAATPTRGSHNVLGRHPSRTTVGGNTLQSDSPLVDVPRAATLLRAFDATDEADRVVRRAFHPTVRIRPTRVGPASAICGGAPLIPAIQQSPPFSSASPRSPTLSARFPVLQLSSRLSRDGNGASGVPGTPTAIGYGAVSTDSPPVTPRN